MTFSIIHHRRNYRRFRNIKAAYNTIMQSGAATNTFLIPNPYTKDTMEPPLPSLPPRRYELTQHFNEHTSQPQLPSPLLPAINTMQILLQEKFVQVSNKAKPLSPRRRKKERKNSKSTHNYFPRQANEGRAVSREFMSYLSRNFHSGTRMWILASPSTSIGHSAGKQNRCGLPKRGKKSTDQSKH